MSLNVSCLSSLARGIKQVVVMDSCKGAMHSVRQRNAAGGRLGLFCVVADPSSPTDPYEGALPSLSLGSSSSESKTGPSGREHVSSLRFDLVVDKCTIDVMLTREDGWQRAAQALKWLHGRMRTPGTLMLVSHSPPHERIELLNTIYWHDMKFKVVRCSTVEDLVSSKPYREELEDYPFAVPEWERQLAIRRSAKASGAERSANDGSSRKGRPLDVPSPTSLPEGSMTFSPGTAFVYILEK